MHSAGTEEPSCGAYLFIDCLGICDWIIQNLSWKVQIGGNLRSDFPQNPKSKIDQRGASLSPSPPANFVGIERRLKRRHCYNVQISSVSKAGTARIFCTRAKLC